MSDDMDLVIITGLSGSGMTEATKSFEDMGFLVMDNLPPSVMEQVVDLSGRTGVRRLGVVVRPSGREFFTEFFVDLGQALETLREKGADYRIVYLDASDEALVRRYEAQRRPHPLGHGDRIQDGIARERQLLEVLKHDADVVIDTSSLTPHGLRDRLRAVFAIPGQEALQISVMTFGYKHGLPIDADMVFDARFLPNPHWVADLRPLTGNDERVRAYVMGHAEASAYLTRIHELLVFLLPGFMKEGKHYLTVAIGCTGGRHRSVALGNELVRLLDESGFPATVHHRDLDRE